jgi:hypothetical protein
MSVIFSVNYSFSGKWRLVDSETLLVTNFLSLKIKPIQSFGCADRDMVYVCMFIELNTHIKVSASCILCFSNIYICYSLLLA